MGNYEMKILLEKLKDKDFLTTEEVVKFLEKFLNIYNYVIIEKYLYSNDYNTILVQFTKNSNYCAMNNTEITSITLNFYVKDLKVVNVTKNEVINKTSVLF